MKYSRETFIKRFLCSQTNTKLFNKENKLYCFFLHEDLYPIIIQNNNSSSKKVFSTIGKINIKKNPTQSFLTIKYCIFLFRSNKFSGIKRSFFCQRQSFFQKKDENYFELKKKIIFYLFFESLTFILLGSQKKNDSEKIFFRTKDVSIQRPLASVENQWQYSSFVFQGFCSRFIHPEVVVRILRRKIRDISFLHLIRKVLHCNLDLSSNTFINLSFKKIRDILWNIYLLEIDKFFVSSCKNYSISRKKTYISSNYSLSCFHKIQEWNFFFETTKYNSFDFFETEISSKKFFSLLNISNSENCSLEKKKHVSFLVKSFTYKYFRTKSSWLLFFQTQKPSIFLIKRRIRLFFIRRLGFVLQTNTKNLPFIFSEWSKADAAYIFFLSYVLQFLQNKKFLKINTKFFFLLTYFVKRIICFLSPLYLIILILSKENFCNFLGYPKSKSSWVGLTDTDIIYQFNRIQASLFLFYSGCNNKKALSQIQYILHFSCAKTLACKHKTNLRHIIQKFGKKNSKKNILNNINSFREDSLATAPFSSEFFANNQSKNFRLRSFWENQKKVRFWNYHAIQGDSIIFTLEDYSKLVKI